jgi:hypothetical protein
MGDKTNKILLMAAAGVMMTGRLIPAPSAQAEEQNALPTGSAAQADQVLMIDDVDGDDKYTSALIEAALQNARTDQALVSDDGDDSWGLY